MSDSLPYFSYYPSNFDSSTRHMTPEQVGVYQRLLNWSWLNGALPPDDELALQSIAGATQQSWERVWSVVGRKWKAQKDGLRNPRLEEERARAKATVERNRSAAEARWQSERSSGGDAPAHASADATAYPSGNAKRMPCKKEEVRSKKEDTEPRTTRAASGPPSWSIDDYEIPAGLNGTAAAALQGWLDYRKAARLKKYVASRWITDAWRRCDQDPERLAAAVAVSIDREWKGIYEDGKRPAPRTGGHPAACACVQCSGRY